MTYELKGGEVVHGGILFGWTGRACPSCQGSREDAEARRCKQCSGTGKEWGRMPVQPADLPVDTE